MRELTELRCEVADLRREIRDLTVVIIRGFRNLGASMSTQFANIDDAITGLNATVTDDNTVEDGLVTLTGQLFTLWQQAAANAGSPLTTDQLAALSALNDKLVAQKEKSASAILANTPAASPAPPAPTA